MGSRAATIKTEKIAELKAGQNCVLKDSININKINTNSSEASGSLSGHLKTSWEQKLTLKSEVNAEGKIAEAASDVENNNKETIIQCTDGDAEFYKEQFDRINDVYRKQSFYEHVSERIDTLSSGQYVEVHDGNVHTYSKTSAGCIKEEIDEGWWFFNESLNPDPEIHCAKEIPPPSHSENSQVDKEALQALAHAGLIDIHEDDSIQSEEINGINHDSGNEIT